MMSAVVIFSLPCRPCGRPGSAGRVAQTLARNADGSPLPAGGRLFPGEPQLDPEPAAAAFTRLDADPPFEPGHRLADDGETDAGTGVALDRVQPLEDLENA